MLSWGCEPMFKAAGQPGLGAALALQPGLSQGNASCFSGFSNKTKTRTSTPAPQEVLTVVCSPAGKAQLPDKDRKELEGQLKAREDLLLPIYHQVAVQFADLHDTPGHMLEKGIISVRVPVATRTQRDTYGVGMEPGQGPEGCLGSSV